VCSSDLRIARVVAATAGSLARAPAAPTGLVASGGGAAPVVLDWDAADPSRVDHYVLAVRAVTENLYRARWTLPPGAPSHAEATAVQLGLGAADAAFFVSVAAVDAAGHESLFAYPEYRCDAAGCVVQPGSALLTATRPL
jgi:hypothetical protein